MTHRWYSQRVPTRHQRIQVPRDAELETALDAWARYLGETSAARAVHDLALVGSECVRLSAVAGEAGQELARVVVRALQRPYAAVVFADPLRRGRENPNAPDPLVQASFASWLRAAVHRPLADTDLLTAVRRGLEVGREVAEHGPALAGSPPDVASPADVAAADATEDEGAVREARGGEPLQLPTKLREALDAASATSGRSPEDLIAAALRAYLVELPQELPDIVGRYRSDTFRASDDEATLAADWGAREPAGSS